MSSDINQHNFEPTKPKKQKCVNFSIGSLEINPSTLLVLPCKNSIIPGSIEAVDVDKLVFINKQNLVLQMVSNVVENPKGNVELSNRTGFFLNVLDGVVEVANHLATNNQFLASMTRVCSRSDVNTFPKTLSTIFSVTEPMRSL